MSPRASNSDQKERIHRTAAQRFARSGYHGTGARELPDAVGLGLGPPSVAASPWKTVHSGR